MAIYDRKIIKAHSLTTELHNTYKDTHTNSGISLAAPKVSISSKNLIVMPSALALSAVSGVTSLMAISNLRDLGGV